MFTREFVVSFDATPEKILSWLQSSNGTKHAFNGKTTLADTYMQLTPGGGAQFAEITISNGGTRVLVRCYWS